MRQDSRPVATLVPWHVVRQQMANWDDTRNKSVGEGWPLPVLRCRSRPGRWRHHSRGARSLQAAVKALCVSVDGECSALVITHDEASRCFSSTRHKKRGDTVDVLLNVTNMTLCEECPLTPDHGRSSQANAYTQNYTKMFAQTPNDIEMYGRTPITTELSLTDDHARVPDDIGAQSNQRNAMHSWELTVDVIICALVMTFILFVVVTVMKRVNKDSDQDSQEENVELASEETLLDYHEATSSALMQRKD